MPQERTASIGTEGTVRSVARVVGVLSLFDAENTSRELREIVQLTGLPKTTAVRLLGTLGSLGLIAQRADATYSVGPVFLRWVKLADSVWEVGRETRDIMSSLTEETGETVNVYIRRDLTRVSIAQSEGRTTVRSVVEVGVPYPLSAGAAAQILLGDASPDVFDQLAAKDDSRAVDALRREVTEVRQAGCALTHGQRELGASAVAAPILAADGRVLAALSATGPASRFTANRVGSYIDAVTGAAKRISEVGLGPVEAFL